MARGPRYKVPFRRRREGRTDYRQRAKLLRSRIPRAVVRVSLKNTTIQFIDYDPKGDKILASAHSKELTEIGWNISTGNVPAAYLTGYLAGKRAKKAGVSESVLDIGLKVPTKGAACFAALKGMIDAGLKIPHGKDVLPSEERIRGHHIGEETEKLFVMVKSKMERD
jgi:large subunit ribosomal protein L18